MTAIAPAAGPIAVLRKNCSTAPPPPSLPEGARMTEKKEQRRGLGRGLSALLSDLEEAPSGTASDQPGAAGGTPAHVSIDLVAPNPSQPRRRFDEEDLVDLAAS